MNRKYTNKAKKTAFNAFITITAITEIVVASHDWLKIEPAIAV